MNTLKERLKEARTEAGLSQAALAKRAGCGQTTIASVENGRNQGSTILPRLAEILGVEPLWLAEGRGQKRRMYPSGLSVVHSGQTDVSPLSYGTNGGSMAESNAEQAPALGPSKRVPVVGTASLGDNGFWAELESPVGFGDGFVPFPTKSSSTYALRCRGDSMKPRIKDGEFVIVDPEVTPSPGDEVLVKSKDGRVMVKELLYVRDDAVHLLSVNEAHGKMSIPLPDVECLHYVAAIIKRSMWQTY